MRLVGEAYFDVKRDSIQPFKVIANDMEVEVLGTQFNISNYPQETFVRTVLVEGSVRLNSKNIDKQVLLKPNQMAEMNKTASKISVADVKPSLYVGWTQGKLIFRNNSFDEICRALERKYAVKIELNNDRLKTAFFDASFDVETLEEVLESFQHSYPFEYKRVNDHVVID